MHQDRCKQHLACPAAGYCRCHRPDIKGYAGALSKTTTDSGAVALQFADDQELSASRRST